MSSLLSARARIVALFVVIAAFALVPVAQGATTRIKVKDYYVAIGDSLAFGYQQAKFNALYPNENPAAYNTGYVDVFGARLKQVERESRIKNYGCPGETSSSLLNGGCGYHAAFPLHENYPATTPQFTAALSFVKSHKGDVSPITLNIGANDLLGTINNVCHQDPLCIQQQAPAVIAAVAGNTANALGQLKAAAPKADIIVMGLYNPLFTIPGSDALTVYYNSVIAQVAAGAGARFADPFPVINNNEPTSVCSQIAICTPLQDIHPFDNGYAAIGNVFIAAAGL